MGLFVENDAERLEDKLNQIIGLLKDILKALEK